MRPAANKIAALELRSEPLRPSQNPTIPHPPHSDCLPAGRKNVLDIGSRELLVRFRRTSSRDADLLATGQAWRLLLCGRGEMAMDWTCGRLMDRMGAAS